MSHKYIYIYFFCLFLFPLCLGPYPLPFCVSLSHSASLRSGLFSLVYRKCLVCAQQFINECLLDVRLCHASLSEGGRLLAARMAFTASVLQAISPGHPGLRL